MPSPAPCASSRVSAPQVPTSGCPHITSRNDLADIVLRHSIIEQRTPLLLRSESSPIQCLRVGLRPYFWVRPLGSTTCVANGHFPTCAKDLQQKKSGKTLRRSLPSNSWHFCANRNRATVVSPFFTPIRGGRSVATPFRSLRQALST